MSNDVEDTRPDPIIAFAYQKALEQLAQQNIDPPPTTIEILALLRRWQVYFERRDVQLACVALGLKLADYP